MIQLNAINSWIRLSPNVNVVLIGDAAGAREIAKGLNIEHYPNVKRNEHGTPLINSAFELARKNSNSKLLTYVNCDIVLLKDFQRSIERIVSAGWQRFLAIGRRVDVDIRRQFDFSNLHQIEKILTLVKSKGRLAPIVCKDFFTFDRHSFDQMPPFAVGRGNWDNWMVHTAKSNEIPVVDISQSTHVIHQNHDYKHIGNGGRLAAYVTGEEAKSNEALAGGKHIISGSSSNWVLTPTRLKRRAFSAFNLPFWSDLPNFARLLRSLWHSRKTRKNVAN